MGSKSPRRKHILEQAGFHVDVVSFDVEEDYPDNLKEDEIAEYLAIKKAQPCLSLCTEDKLIITADSIVVLDGIVYGKPESYEHAVEILSRLSGNVHQVYTGVCIADLHRTKSFTERSDIRFAKLDLDEIHYYLETCKPFDKAGAYGIQDWIGLCKVEWIDGTFSNIMGLPMAKLYEHIKNWHVI
ncbi:MAG: Maf family protein [Saprospiraceae bacterium]|nr:Maf family protein [Saprospiraceae bacterium]